MISSLIHRAEKGEPLWLPELRSAFKEAAGAKKTIIRLLGSDGFVRDFELFFPAADNVEEADFLLRYAVSNVYNILSIFSGREVRIFCDSELRHMLSSLPRLFDSEPGFKKVKNIARRIHGSFLITFSSIDEYHPISIQSAKEPNDLTDRLKSLCTDSDKENCIGVDIGGSDIKMAASVQGKLIWTKEYDWNPASSPTAEGIIDPVISLIKEGKNHIEQFGGELNAVGISFPDIVIHDQIVGGETPKTKAMRENIRLDYEKEFDKIRNLKRSVLPLCAQDGRVRLTNDGNMAAFTAAVELAAGGEEEKILGGIVAHSLGTDLGTGWLLPDGTIPAFPLEFYDLLLDLGDFPAAALSPEDLRSTRNENSGMNGVRRYLGQAAAYRLAWKRDPSLIEGFVERSDDLQFVPTSPADLRKPCLEHLMQKASQGVPEAEEVFREIGRNLSVVTQEMIWLFGSTPSCRILFGRFVKTRRCFELLREGFEKGNTGITLLTADEDLSNTSLMKQLAQTPDVTVAQFAQAIGSIYFAFS